MKKLFTIILSFASIFCTTHIWAQSGAGENININNIDAMLRVTGDHFWDLVQSPRYEVPKGSRKHTIFASALWMGGLENNNLHVAAMTYRQAGSDFWPGPLDTLLGTIDVPNSEEWDKMWKVSQKQIDDFRQNKNNATDAIKTWPAHGNQSFGQAKYLAPFVDVDNDGIYDYTKGDYPKIKGDQTIWWVFNDQNLAHSETEGKALGVEIHAMAYAFSSKNTTLNNTIFLEYNVINRSQNNYNDVYLGLWTDFDIGYGFDDAIGCDSSLSAYFGYNADTFDEGSFGYGDNIPVQSVAFLKDSMQGFISYNNDFTDNGNPENPEHYYRYTQGLLRSGASLINPQNNKNTKFQYSGNPLNTNEWSMRSPAQTKPKDKRGVGSTGPFELKRNKSLTFTFAYITTFKGTGSTDGNLKEMHNDIATVKNYYNQNLNTSTAESQNPQEKTFTFSAYPNPANASLTLQWNNSGARNVRLVNMLGQTVWSQEIERFQTQIKVDTKHFPRGIYIAVIENGSQKAVTRVVLQ
ncbi:MAG: T9SS type A sorting domain-containing protein [Sphingobacteriales bacterium]|nr:MAG: T9SS type A sorting domain-containing protein [Sphingobacteriales bacterium]